MSENFVTGQFILQAIIEINATVTSLDEVLSSLSTPDFRSVVQQLLSQHLADHGFKETTVLSVHTFLGEDFGPVDSVA